MAGTTTDVENTRMQPGDWPGVAAVSAEGIRTGAATFETEVPSWERGSATTSTSIGSLPARAAR